ncbi:lysozyme family protein [Vagococcus fluvialis]|uniref:lysozyme family protein n=1 Tax=Vagococcus fluvialis TaxID=2738 RepID=UPI0028F72D35|nr:lysozyme family protein [Vagococcus fluvialis]WNF91623.1 lysozyme family protein [Vagococcus fluvialis]
MKTLNQLRKFIQGKANSAEKMSLLWKLALFIVSNLITLLMIGFFGIMLIILFTAGSSNNNSDFEGGGIPLPESVLRWKNDVDRIANKNGVSQYVDILLGIIMVESRGEDLDIMQSSESAGLGPNGFDDPIDSLEQGIKYFATNAKMAESQGVDIWAAVQGYNFGSGYISYVAENGKTHSTSIAENFSRDVVSKQLGNTSGSTYSYVNAVSVADGRTYLYLNGGNFHYVGLVKQYLSSQQGGNGNVGNGEYRIPFDGTPVITSPYSNRISPITGQPEFHLGQDFAQPAGTKILASMGGKVVLAEYHNSYGNYVLLQHSNGTWTAYAHNSQLLVKVGQTVSQGDVLAIIGTTGDSTGIHTHFEIRKSMFGDHVDPAPYLKLQSLLFMFVLRRRKFNE